MTRRRMKLMMLVALVMMVSALAGCGGTDDDSNESGSVTPKVFSQKVLRIWCEKSLECCGEKGLHHMVPSSDDPPIKTVDECMSEWDLMASDFKYQLSHSKVSYDAGKAASCAEAFEKAANNASCSDFLDIWSLEECKDVATGTLKDGEKCDGIDFECESRRCSRDTEPVCIEPKDDGEECTYDWECLSGRCGLDGCESSAEYQYSSWNLYWGEDMCAHETGE